MSNQAFLQSIQIIVDSTKADVEAVARVTGIKILAQLVRMSPVGNPDVWEANQTAVAFNEEVTNHNNALRNDEANLTKTGRLRKGLKVHDSMDIKAPPGYTGGRFKANWFVGMDSQPVDATDDVDRTGNISMRRGRVILETFKVGMTSIYFANNLPYAYELEMGHSKQAPGGMVRITAQDFQKLLSEAVKEVRNG
ncbi:hypothetical protein EDF88_4184 [Buttiauxella sp. BIGb0552]|uniref:hypothetical protein n=1 Tax=Buttiauxella sp. BIGb0552 TaxID=2485120 RepID=UPI001065E7D1|nr:hypothetical protein [Buttiauxella sp. BIGb0552]TDX14857.1 hypothetical protein EDF88_4184 [Buttiauxella sp. BIGb0552]